MIDRNFFKKKIIESKNSARMICLRFPDTNRTTTSLRRAYYPMKLNKLIFTAHYQCVTQTDIGRR